jgi:hypothetical protein
MATPMFKSTMCPVPGGTFWYELNGEHVEAREWHDMRRLVSALMAKHGVKGSPDLAVAAQMCPELPAWYCTTGGRPVLRAQELRDNAKRYFGMNLVPYPEMARRLAICRACPRHTRKYCLTCTGHLQWLLAGFGGRRERLPDDSLSGTCEAAKTFEVAVTSVDGPLPEWEDVPATCWRNQK